MIYLSKTEEGKEDYNITAFFGDEKKWKSYLILVMSKPGEEMLIAKQIHRQHLDEANWFITTVEDFVKIFVPGFRKKEFLNLIVMELTMTGNKDDVIMAAHNWDMLVIDHEPKTYPFDEALTNAVNEMVDQVMFNYVNETIPFQKKVDKLLYDLMATGMFKMQADPEKQMGGS